MISEKNGNVNVSVISCDIKSCNKQIEVCISKPLPKPWLSATLTSGGKTFYVDACGPIHLLKVLCANVTIV